ncbi:MAG: hypothetical protein AAF738_03620 [Bacteroidota bacterium]
MPAQQKYLSSTRQRILKISAGILGGFILSMALHLVVGAFIEDKGVMIITSAYSAFLVWILFMILAFLFKNGWYAWGTYLLATGICAGLIYWAL